jgi:hypothetical protein
MLQTPVFHMISDIELVSVLKRMTTLAISATRTNTTDWTVRFDLVDTKDFQ